MRPYVIVTIQTVNKDFVYDIEVPTNVPAGRLAKDIIEALTAYNSSLSQIYLRGSLFCKRLDSIIPEDIDFLEAGIWSGDIIIIS